MPIPLLRSDWLINGSGNQLRTHFGPVHVRGSEGDLVRRVQDVQKSGITLSDELPQLILISLTNLLHKKD
jgi:hypothetical protein